MIDATRATKDSRIIRGMVLRHLAGGVGNLFPSPSLFYFFFFWRRDVMPGSLLCSSLEGKGSLKRGERHVQWRLSGKVCDFSVVRRGKEKGRDEMHNRVRYRSFCTRISSLNLIRLKDTI